MAQNTLWEDFRRENPQYDGVDDDELAAQLHAEYYSDVPYNEWRTGVGLEQIPDYEEPARQTDPPSLIDRALEAREAQLKSDADTLAPELEDFEREKDEDTEVGFVENLGRRGIQSVNRVIADTIIGVGALTRPLGVGLELAWIDATMEDGMAKDIAMRERFERPNLFVMGAQMMKERDYGQNEAETTEELEQKWKAAKDIGQYGSALADTIGWGFTEGAASIPDMAATIWNLPFYMVSATGRIGQERARNKGKPQADAEDMMEAAPFAVGSALFEKYGAEKFIKLFGSASEDVITEVGKDFLERALQNVQAAGKGATTEALTEAVQEGGFEYVGETFGTNERLSWEDSWHRAKWGAVGGATFGGPAGSLSDAAGQLRATIAGQYIPDEFMNDPDQVSEDDLRDAGEAPDVTDPPPDQEPPPPEPDPDPEPDPVDMTEDEAREAWWNYQTDIDNLRLQLEDLVATNPDDPRVQLLKDQLADKIGLQDRIPFQPPTLGDEIGVPEEDLAEDQIPTGPATIGQTIDTALREVKGLGRNTDIPMEPWEMEEMTRRVAAGEDPKEVAALFWADLLPEPEVTEEPGEVIETGVLGEAPPATPVDQLSEEANDFMSMDPHLAQQVADLTWAGADLFESLPGWGDYWAELTPAEQAAIQEFQQYALANPGLELVGPGDMGELRFADTRPNREIVDELQRAMRLLREQLPDEDFLGPEDSQIQEMIDLVREKGLTETLRQWYELDASEMELLEDIAATIAEPAPTADVVTIRPTATEGLADLVSIGEQYSPDFDQRELTNYLNELSEAYTTAFNAINEADPEQQAEMLQELNAERDRIREIIREDLGVTADILEFPSSKPAEEVETHTPDDNWKFHDPRLRHPDYREQLEGMKSEILTKQGVGSLIRDPNTGEPVGRVTSGNPPWVQDLLGAFKMTGEQLQNAIDRALEGKRKLGVRQRAVVDAMLEQIREQRNDPDNLTYYRNEMWKAREQRRIRNDPAADLLSDELINDILSGDVFVDDNPFGDFTPEERLIGTLAFILRNRGGDPEPIAAADLSNADMIAALTEAIYDNEGRQQGVAPDEAAGVERPPAETQEELFPRTPEERAAQDEADRIAAEERAQADREAAGTDWTGTLWGEDRAQTDIADAVERAPEFQDSPAGIVQEALRRLSAAVEDTIRFTDDDLEQMTMRFNLDDDLVGAITDVIGITPEDLNILEEDIVPELLAELDARREMDAESADEALAVEEGGIMFLPGQPVTFEGRQFAEAPTGAGGDIQPAAPYLRHEPGGEDVEVVTFENPLYVPMNRKGGIAVDEFGWRYELMQRFNATGRELAQAIAQAGHDGIVTIEVGFDGQAVQTGFIVDLRGVTPTDRRLDADLRARWDQMSPEEQYILAFQDPHTGLGNKRYMEELKAGAKYFAYLDLDNLGALNDFLGHDAGDALVATAGEIIQRHTQRGEAFRPGGDEFVLFGDSMEELQATIEAINRELAGAGVANSKGELKGLAGSWGLGTTIERADMAMLQEKKARTEAGQREQLEKGQKPRNLHMAGTSQDEIQKSRNPLEDTQAWNPGKNYVPMIGKLKDLPLDAKDNYVLSDGRRVRIPKKPLRVVHILRMMQDVLGLNIYEGRIKGPRTELGYYRKQYGEIRTKNRNDLETSAHEVGHWFDDRMPFIEEMYNKEPFKTELRGVSYDAKSTSEGFAEYFRLWFTQEHEAVARAPMFHDAFMGELETNHPDIYKQLRTLQEMFHAWYFQGADARIRSQIGGGKPTDIPLQIWWREWRDHATDWVLQKMFDGFRRVKQFERAMNGFVMDAEFSPWKNFIMTRNSGEMTKYALERGTFTWSDDRREFTVTGESLKDVFKGIDDGRLEKGLLYIVGLRAQNLESQGRKTGFTRTDIRRMISYGEADPDIRDANERYQAWNDRMLQFYVDSGLLSEDQVASFKEWNENYIPFNRVVESYEKKGVVSKGKTPFKRLVGSDRNLEDVMQSIIGNTSHYIHMALVNESKALMYDMIERGSRDNPQEAANWAVPISEETRQVSIPKERIEDAIINALGYTRKEYDDIVSVGAINTEEEYLLARVKEAVESNMTEFVSFWFQDKAPEGMVDSVFRDGQKYYYEVADPLLFEAIQHAGPKAFHWGVRVLGGFSTALRTGIVSFLPFQFRNFMRDTMQAWSLSKGKTLPVLSAVRELWGRVARDGVYHEYILNGGGFSSIAQAEGIGLHQVMDMNMPVRSIKGGAQRLLHQWQRIIGTMEYANRVAEYRGQVARGVSPREAAFAGRQISTDFAMRGSSTLIQHAAILIPFLNARMQGGYRLGREIMSRPPGERLRLRGRDAALYATKAFVSVTIPTLVLLAMNEDDEVYEELPQSTKDTNWFFRTGPGEDDYVLIPKPFETGLMWGTSFELMIKYLRDSDENELADAILWNFINVFSVDLPAAVHPVWELERNKNWTGAPIVPDYMREDVEPFLQYKHYTSDAMVALGKKWNVSPLKAQHLMEGYLGTAGQYLMAIADFMTGDYNNGGVEPRPHWRPEDSEVAFQLWGMDFYESLPQEILASQFLDPFINKGPLKRTQSQERFYKLLSEARTAANSVQLMKLRDPVRLNEYLSDKEKRYFFGLSSAMEQVQRQVNQINSAIETVSTSTRYDANEKRRRIDELLRRRNRAFQQVIDRLRNENTDNIIEKILRMELPTDPNDERELPDQVGVQ